MLPKQMASAHQMPATFAGHLQEPSAAGADASAAERALVPSPLLHDEGTEPAFTVRVMRLPVELDVAVPAQEFRVRNLLALEPGQVIGTHWAHSEDVPLASGDVQLAWTEFEVVDTQLAVRITRLA
jgi:flagellar motor switch/type III secretory pathway protein FliN